MTWRAMRWHGEHEFPRRAVYSGWLRRRRAALDPRRHRLLLDAGSTLVELAMFASLLDQRVPDRPGGRPAPSRCATTLRVTRVHLAGRLIGDVTALSDRIVALVGDSKALA
ncbi:hypothetical protein [Nonomuraea jiangxiensis]|uniref:hypothetical protein n=1 Tax=Nonomuraea jiangxiensis TaxID=633440 RepID=UPI00115FDCD1|nr:hypothetical protein [Nonomuraea jiangxiensis]